MFCSLLSFSKFGVPIVCILPTRYDISSPLRFSDSDQSALSHATGRLFSSAYVHLPLLRLTLRCVTYTSHLHIDIRVMCTYVLYIRNTAVLTILVAAQPLLFCLVPAWALVSFPFVLT